MKPKKSMSKGRVVGGGAKRGLLIRGKWKAVELDPSLFANEDMGGIVCFEELTDYSLVDSDRAQLPAEKSPKKKNTEKKKKKKNEAEEEEEEKNEAEDEEEKKEGKKSKKGKKRKSSTMTEVENGEKAEEDEEGEEGMMMEEGEKEGGKEEELAEPPAKKKKKRPKKKKKNAAAANQGQAESGTGDADAPEQKSTPEEAGTGPEQDPPGTNPDPPGNKSQAQDPKTEEDKLSVTPKKKNKNKNKKKKKTTADEQTEASPTADEQTEASSQDPPADQKKQTQKNKKKEKKKAKEVSPSTAASATVTAQPVKKKQQKKKKEVKNWTSAALEARGGTAGADVSAWKDLFVPPPVLQALSCLGFAHPTPIQALALPPAIRDHLDVLGAAETGSGKTLSFGIPILHNILEWKQNSETWIANKKAELEATANQTAEEEATANEVAAEAEAAANGSAQEEDETPPPASDVTSSTAAAAEGNSGKAEEETPAVKEDEDGEEETRGVEEEEEDGEGEDEQEVAEEEDQSEEEGEEEEELELHSEDDDDDDDEEAVDPASDEGGEDDLGDDVDDEHDDDDDAAAADDRGCVQIRSVEEGDSHAPAEQREEEGEGPKQPLLALVLTPTRELAVQVKHHIDAIAQFTGIRTAIVVGGMAPQKQHRVLSRRPEIVIATPGRLWDLIKDGHPHLTNLRHLRSLVIDEADRMVERGHFAELENLLEMLNTSQFNPKRQTFVFSATLTMVHSLPLRVMQKKSKRGQQNPNSNNKLELLMQKVGIRDKPKVIDLTRQQATVETLVETRIQCEKEEKDFYLYYFLSQYPGRTMVFANSIECIKRLSSLLLILDQTPLPLHANMHQKQRLKNLERFAEREHCVLLTTDVAARGLDIPDVQHVIHYQVPRTSETYVHRSGRTARATKQGLSLLLISPDDLLNYKKIYRTLGKDEDLPVFPVQTRCMAAIKERVKLAWRIEKIEYHNSKQRQHNSWFTQQAEAMDIDLDDDVLMAAGRDKEADMEQQRLVKGLKKQLKHLLGQPVFRSEMKTRYPTQMGKLQLPQLPLATAETAITSLANQKTDKRQWTHKKPNKK